MPPRAPRRRILAAAAIAASAALALAGCTGGSSNLTSDYASRAGQGYVSGDGSVVTVPASKREKTPAWSVTDYDGAAVSSAALKGKVVLLNFWYAGCPPCRAEAPQLEKLYSTLSPEGVVFLGVNTEDGAATAKGFAAKYGLQYPSVLDADEGVMVQTFAGDVPANAVPVTLILDRRGRVAARFSGAITSRATVETIVRDVLAEKG